MSRTPLQATLSQGQYWFKLLSSEVCVGIQNNEPVAAIGFDLEPTVDRDVFADLTVAGRILKISGDTQANDVGQKTSGRMGLCENELELLLYGSERQLDFLQMAFVQSPDCHAILRIETDKKIHSALRKSGHEGLAIMSWNITIHKRVQSGCSDGQ